MKTKKFTFKPTLTILFCIMLFAGSVEAQTSIISNSGNVSGITSGTTINNWQNVGLPVSVTLSTGNKVLVLSTFEADVTNGPTDILGKYQITDGTLISPTIERYVVAKAYDDHGIGAISYIFTYGGETAAKAFQLQHAKGINGNKQFTTKGVIVAMVINDANIKLPNSNKITTTPNVTTTSTEDYVEVTGTKTDVITLTKPGGIYLTTSFSTLGDGALIGYYVLRSSSDGTNFTNIPDAAITRTNSINPGAATISILLEDQPAGDYYFDVAHKTSTGTLTTRNLSLNVVGLVDANGLVFQTFKSTVASVVNSTASFTTAASNTITSLNGTNKVFFNSTFNMSSPDIVDAAAFQLVSSGGTFTSQILERYVPAGGTGSGGLVGLVTELNTNTIYTFELQHRSTAAVALTTSNINLVGFQLTSSPTFVFNAASGDWNTASNWTPGLIPGISNSVSIPSDKTALIAADDTASCNGLA